MQPPYVKATAPATWPATCRHIRIWINTDTYHPDLGMPLQTFLNKFDDALNTWNSVINIHLQRVNTPGTAHVDVQWLRLAGNTLAWSHLADGTCSRSKQQRYDFRPWNPHLFFQTVLHEVGHLIGLSHKSGHYVMNPSILTAINGLTMVDIERALALGYDTPTQTPTPPPTPTPTPDPLPPGPPPPTPTPTPAPRNPMTDFIALLTILLPLFKNCDTARREQAKGPGGRLARRLALRYAAQQTGQTWREVRDLPEAQDFIAYGFDDADLEAASRLLRTETADATERLHCGNE